jgi:hypothetical protein
MIVCFLSHTIVIIEERFASFVLNKRFPKTYHIYSCIAPAYTLFAEFYPRKHGLGVYTQH